MAEMPAKDAGVVSGRRVKALRISEKPCGPAFAGAGEAGGDARRERGDEASIREGRLTVRAPKSDTSLTSFASSFLPRYSGVRPTPQPGDEHPLGGRWSRRACHKSGADAAAEREDDPRRAECDEGHHADERREAVMHRE